MKLINAHIENYGSLHDHDIVFEDGLTCLCLPNGKGKTTVASFIRAMFYGLPTVRARSSDFNDRQHFYPFSGGKFGGYLVLEQGGDRYRIERYFDEKSETKDRITVYKNDTEDRSVTDPGQFFFGIDGESFSRTLFITADQIDDDTPTTCISARLGDLADGGDENESGKFDKALASLKAAAKKIRPERGIGGELGENAEKEKKLIAQIKNCETLDGDLERKYREREQLSEKLKKTAEELRLASEAENRRKLLEEKKKTLLSFRKRIDDDRAAVEKILSRYPAGIPTAEETVSLREHSADAADAAAALRAIEAAGGADEGLQKLKEKYPSGIPDEQEIERAEAAAKTVADTEAALSAVIFPEEKVGQLTRLRAIFRGTPSLPSENEFTAAKERCAALEAAEKEKAFLEGQKTDGRYEEAAAHFPAVSVSLTADELDGAKKEYARYSEAGEKLISLSAAIAAETAVNGVNGGNGQTAGNGTEPKKKSGPLFFAALAVGALLIAAAVWLIVAGHPAPGAAAGVLALCAILAGVIFGRSRSGGESARTPTALPSDVESERIGLYRTKESSEKALIAFLAKYGFYTGNVAGDMAELESSYAYYTEKKEEYENRAARIARCGKEIAGSTAALEEFFGRFELPSDPDPDLTTYPAKVGYLIRASEKLAELEKERAAAEQTAEALEEKLGKAKNDIHSILSRYGLSLPENASLTSLIASLKTDLASFRRLSEEKGAAEARGREAAEKRSAAFGAARIILAKYGLPLSEDLTDGGIGDLAVLADTDRGEKERLEADLARMTAEAEKYRSENLSDGEDAENGAADAPVSVTVTDELEKEADELRAAIAALDQRIDSDEAQTEQLPSLYSELDAVREKGAELREKHRITLLTAELLEKAEQNQRQRYVAPVRDSFVSYSDAIEKAFGEKVSLDRDYRLFFEKDGERRTEKHMSTGERAVCAFCMRLAFIDNMFRGAEVPFVVMDDPFVTLDGDRMKKTAALIRSLASGGGKQMIYFCCHESRII